MEVVKIKSFSLVYTGYIILSLLFVSVKAHAAFYHGDDKAIRYTGRVQHLPGITRVWSPGAYFEFAFSGDSCQVILEDEMRYGVQHNYIEIQLDKEAPIRIRLQAKTDTITLLPLSKGQNHTVLIAKNTEASIGYIDMVGIIAASVSPHKNSKGLLIEFIGDSITCGASSDASSVKCGAGRWEDQHNAYMAYGPVAARKLKADWILSAVSGIGLIHSCCNMQVLMPQVFDKVDMKSDSIAWNFKKYKPDIISICLGQNDGIQDSLVFQKTYIGFIKNIRKHHPQAKVVLLTSPMADPILKVFLQQQLAAVQKAMRASGDKKVYTYFFKNVYNKGCDYHPDVSEHEKIAGELVAFLKAKGIAG